MRNLINGGSFVATCRHCLGLVCSLVVFNLTASAQVVGYVNVPVTNGYQILCNPLQIAGNNAISNVFALATPSQLHQATVSLWNPTNQTFAPASEYVSGSGWSVPLQLPPGRGFVLRSAQSFLLTFVGEIASGTYTNYLAGTNQLTLLGSPVPAMGSLATDLLFPGYEGDLVSLFAETNQTYPGGFMYFTNYGWLDPSGGGGTTGPSVAVGRGFFVRHRGPDTNWIRNFVLGSPPATLLVAGASASAAPPPPRILQLRLAEGNAELTMSEAQQPYDVRFSSDGIHWVTLSINQTGRNWSGPVPPGALGYFQLANSATP